jgi:hypothetical protein
MWFVPWLAGATVIALGRTDRVPGAQLERALRRAFDATGNNALTLEDQSGHRLAMKKPGGWGTGFTEKAWVGPATKKPGLRTGLLQLDAIQTSRRPTCGERGANDIAPAGHQDCQTRNPVPGSGATQKIAGGMILRLSLGNRRFRQAASHAEERNKGSPSLPRPTLSTGYAAAAARAPRRRTDRGGSSRPASGRSRGWQGPEWCACDKIPLNETSGFLRPRFLGKD